MTLYDDYLVFNHLTEGEIRQRVRTIGYEVSLYRTSPTIEIILSYQGEEERLTQKEVRMVTFQSREAVDLYCDVLSGSVPYETFEAWFLSVLPHLDRPRSEGEPVRWRDWLTVNAQLLEHDDTVDLYQTAEWYVLYKGRVITQLSSGRSFFARFQHEVLRMQWILDMLGGLLSAQQTMARLQRLPPGSYADRIEHLALVERQIIVIENQY